MHKFTILTSLYKAEFFIANYFRSIFTQQLLPDEIVLIDDTKNACDLKKIIEEKKVKYKFNNIILLKNKNNIGPAASLNKGLSRCSNNLIFRLDVDDIWLPNHTKKVLKYYEKDNSYLIYANSIGKLNFLNKVKIDKYLINSNSLIHSSWLINRNICKNFKYISYRSINIPEDYLTLLYYKRRNFKFFYTYNITAIHNKNVFGHGNTFGNTTKYLSTNKKISNSFLRLHLKNKNFLQKLYFILFQYGLLKFIVLIIWIFDYLKIRYFFNYIKNILNLIKKIIF